MKYWSLCDDKKQKICAMKSKCEERDILNKGLGKKMIKENQPI